MNTKCYVWVHSMLAPIPKGVQSAHAIVELFNKSNGIELLRKWSIEDKTIIMLNGGNNKNLVQIEALLDRLFRNTAIPWSFFIEDDETLNNMITACAVIFPDDLIVKTNGSPTEASFYSFRSACKDYMIRNEQDYFSFLKLLTDSKLAT